MSSFIDKFKKKRNQKNDEKGTTQNNNNQNNIHRDSLNSDHIFIPQNSQTVPSGDIGNGSEIQVRKKPQLAYSLDRLLSDSSALSYFIQFLESTDKLNLIKFWMHVEGFKSSFSEAICAAQELSLRDARSIYEKYLDDKSMNTLSLPRKIKNQLDENMAQVPLSRDCFDGAQEFVRQLFEYRYFEEFKSSVYYKKHELEVLSDGCSLTDILKVHTLLLALLEYINDKEDHSMVQFLLGCDSYESNYNEMDDSEVLSDAMALYDKYFSMQASTMIDLGAPIRSEIESLICDESGRPSMKSFRTAKTACFWHLHDKYLPSFLRSSTYQSYLSELSSIIENTVELPRRCRASRTESSSDAQSSTDSISSVMGRHFDYLDRTQDLNEDKTPTGTPSPSKRSTPRTPRSSRLAEIDELGRYHALYDDSHAHNQTLKTPMRIKSTLRKYLDKNTLREEEIAEEVARTIIQDMQNMVTSSVIP